MASNNQKDQCKHKWISLSKESGVGPTINYEVGISICCECALIQVAGFRGGNHFNEQFNIDLPVAVDAIITHCNEVNEIKMYQELLGPKDRLKELTILKLKALRLDQIGNSFKNNPDLVTITISEENIDQFVDYDQTKYK